ncbi:hypothetical protein [Aureispira anguillae]|uniref:Uncharacterized protein n=1 Tax=Aureispira anguillae TaxID=2864201 RepID=A0A916DQA9_9BACT|nr:hypothetical protein [Aureispira anguillae]BDS11064.1 hypothetical protein AsAng_0017750 [Aureispira anguillae]
MKEFLSIQQCSDTSKLNEIQTTISNDYQSQVFDSSLIISSRINFLDPNQYETIGRFYLVWLFDCSQPLQIKSQYVYYTKSWDGFLHPCGFKDGQLAFFKHKATHLYLSEDMPFQKRGENELLQSLQTNNGIYSLMEVGSALNKTQIIVLSKASGEPLGYLQHLGSENNLKKYIPEYKKTKTTSITDYIRMKGFDDDEKFLNIEHLIDVDNNRLLVIICHRKYKKNPATSTNKNSPFFYLFIDKKTGNITGHLKFVSGLKPFKSTNFYKLEDSPFVEENILAFPLKENLLFKSSKNLILFDKNGKQQKNIPLKGKDYSIIRKMKLVGAYNDYFFLMHLQKGIVVQIEYAENLALQLEKINKELKKEPNRTNLIAEQYLDMENVVVKNYERTKG